MSTLLLTFTKLAPVSKNFTLLFDWLETAGLSFTNPSLGFATKWTDNGQQVRTSRDEVLREISSQSPGSVQLWHGEGKDLYISWKANSVTIFFDARKDPQRLADLALIVKNFATSDAHEVLAWKLSLEYE